MAQNYDGQLTGQNGLHSRYESAVVSYRLAAGPQFAPNTNACVYYASILDAVFTEIDQDYQHNAALLPEGPVSIEVTGGPQSKYPHP